MRGRSPRSARNSLVRSRHRRRSSAYWWGLRSPVTGVARAEPSLPEGAPDMRPNTAGDDDRRRQDRDLADARACLSSRGGLTNGFSARSRTPRRAVAARPDTAARMPRPSARTRNGIRWPLAPRGPSHPHGRDPRRGRRWRSRAQLGCGRHEQSRHAVLDDLGDAADGACYDRTPGRHRLQHRVRQPLGLGGHGSTSASANRSATSSRWP